MPYTVKGNAASARYKAKAIKRVPLDMQRKEYDRLKRIATEKGETVNGFIKRSIRERIERLSDEE